MAENQKPLKLTTPTEIKVEQLVSYDIPVKWAALHTGTDFPGGLGTHQTLTDAKLKGIKMYLNKEWILICVKDRKFGVPLAAFKNFELDLVN